MDKSIIERVDSATHIDSSRLMSPPSFPKSLKIEVTSRCNFNCSYCGVSRKLRKTGDMDWFFYADLIQDAVKLNVKEVGLFLLGEPFLRDDLSSMVKYAKDAGIEYVFITTNGSLCTKTNLESCASAGLDSLKFSINAPRVGYESTHGVQSSTYDYVIEKIKWLYHYKIQNNLTLPRTCVSSIYIQELKEELAGMEADIKPFVDEFYYLPMYSQAGYSSIACKTVGNIGRFENPVPPVPCWGLFNSAKITWDGWLTACCFDHTGHFKIADLNTTSLLDAWNDYKFIELRQEHLDNHINEPVCRTCLGIKEDEINNV